MILYIYYYLSNFVSRKFINIKGQFSLFVVRHRFSRIFFVRLITRIWNLKKNKNKILVISIWFHGKIKSSTKNLPQQLPVEVQWAVVEPQEGRLLLVWPDFYWWHWTEVFFWAVCWAEHLHLKN